MNISEIFIRRPIATSLLMAAIALGCTLAYRSLPISDLPAVEYPTINVSASLPGGDPVTMAASVASPLERQFTTIAGVDEMTSRSGTGNSNITLTFDLNRNIDSAVTDVQTAISAAMPLLPPTLTSAPSFRKQNPADEPILQILAVFVGVLFATVRMFSIVPKGFIPDTDNDRLNVGLNAAQGTSYYEMVGYAQRVADVIRQNPNVEAEMVNTGGQGGQGANFNIQLAPRANRSLSAQQIAQQLRAPLGRFPGFRAFVNVPAALQIGGFRGNSSFNINVQSLNYDELYKWAPVLEKALAELPEVQDVPDNMELKSPRVNMTIDHVGCLTESTDGETIRRLAGHPGSDDSENARDDGAAAWVRHRPPHRADQVERAAREWEQTTETLARFLSPHEA